MDFRPFHLQRRAGVERETRQSVFLPGGLILPPRCITPVSEVWLLISGDNGKKGYDEPSAIRQALIAKGVPEAAIFVIMPDSPRWTPWLAPGKCLAKAALRLSRKHFIINGRSGWRNNMALTYRR